MIQKLTQPIDNSQLILFRFFFGLVFFCESVGSLLTGWAKNNFVEVTTNFSFIGFEWLSFLNGNIIYLVFILMAIFSFKIVIGYNYRFSMISLFLLWGMVYFAQKTSYNNHYYLMWLISFLMIFVPANHYASVDSRKKPEIKKLTSPKWCVWIFPAMISIVYFYATVAKFYPDWLDGTVTSNMFRSLHKPDFLQPIFQNESFHYFIAYTGILFDGLIIPALLYKRTRWIAIIASLIFHIFNSITLQIGVFPYFSLSFCIFFFSPEKIRSVFFKNKPKPNPIDFNLPFPRYTKVFYYLIIPFMALQVALPLRHWFIKGDVLFTEEGHRLAWRMMLRNRSGEAQFLVKNKETNEEFTFDNSLLLSKKQHKKLNTPDVIWQMAQKIKAYYQDKGLMVSVYCIQSSISINGKYYQQSIDPTIDLTNVRWYWYKHEEWITSETTKLRNPLAPIYR